MRRIIKKSSLRRIARVVGRGIRLLQIAMIAMLQFFSDRYAVTLRSFNLVLGLVVTLTRALAIGRACSF